MTFDLSERTQIRRNWASIAPWPAILAAAAPRLLVIALCSQLGVSITASAEQADYTVGAEDVLLITVWGRTELSGKFTVEADGSVKLPLIDRVKVASLTNRQIEEELKNRLAAGYLNNPQVTVVVEQHRSQRVFVQGEVRQPGAVMLTGETRLLEVLTQAGSVTVDAGNEVLVIRQPAPGSANSSSPAAPQVTRIDLADLQTGSLSQNIRLQDGDTVVVPRGEKVYLTGHVRTPGAYSIRKGTTLLQALALAGGVTERGATGRTKLIRMENGKEKKLDAKLDDVVQPGDTIVVPERFF